MLNRHILILESLGFILCVHEEFVQPLGENLKPDGNVLIAADEVGAGFGELVIVTQGTPAMQAFNKGDLIPVDAVVVGIVDNLELADDVSGKKK